METVQIRRICLFFILCLITNGNAFASPVWESTSWPLDEIAQAIDWQKSNDPYYERSHGAPFAAFPGQRYESGNPPQEGLFQYEDRVGSWSVVGKIQFQPTSSDSNSLMGALLVCERPHRDQAPFFMLLCIRDERHRNRIVLQSAWRAPDEKTIHLSLPLPIPAKSSLSGDSQQEFFARITRNAKHNLLVAEWLEDNRNWKTVDWRNLTMAETVSYGIVSSASHEAGHMESILLTDVRLDIPSPVATRMFSQPQYSNHPIDVTLHVNKPSNHTQPIGITETVPNGWTVDRIGQQGVLQKNVLFWTIGETDESLELTYTLRPTSAANDVAVFSGSIDSIPILGDKFLTPQTHKIPIQPGGHWRYWTTADGLRETCGLCQKGGDGRIWIRHGSVNQISCLDGYSVSRIPSPGVWGQIFETNTGQIWSFDSRGLKRFENGEWISYPISGTDFSQTVILPTAQNRVILCLQDRLAEFNAETRELSPIQSIERTQLGAFTNIAMSRNGDIFISGFWGLAKIDRKGRESAMGAAWTEYPIPVELDAAFLGAALEDEEGRIYISALSRRTHKRVLLQFYEGEWSLKCVDEQSISMGWPSVEEGFWVWKTSAYYPVLTFLSGPASRRFETDVSLPSLTSVQLPILERGFPVLYESNRSFWISLSPGIARYAESVWNTPKALSDLSEHVNAICEDPTGRLWFTTFNQLLLFQNETWKHYPLPNGYSTYQWEPNGLAYLKNEKLAIRNMNDVLLLFDPASEQFEAIEHPQGKKISLIFPRSDGTLWVQCEDRTSTRQKFAYSLEIFDGSEFHLFDDRKDQWNIEQLRYIYEDTEGNIWLGGMAEERLGVYRDGKYRTLGEEYPGDSVMCIFPYDSGRLWFSDRKAIYEYDGEHWRTLHTHLDGIPSIVRCRNGSVWLATWNGLYRYDGNSWVENSVEEGLSSFCIFKIFEDSQNRLWAATSLGLNLYHPEADPDPPRVILDPSENGDTVAANGVAKFVFSGIDKWKYTPQNRLLFSHRIDDGLWSPYTGDTVANYSNLTPGSHQFFVKSMDRNGNVSQSAAVFGFTVLLPWYQEPVFLILLIAGSAITLIAVGFAVSRHINLEKLVKIRTRDLQAVHEQLLAYQKQLQSFASEITLIEERDRKQIAAELHDRIGHGLAACQMQIETLLQHPLDSFPSQILHRTLHVLEQTIQDTRTLTFEISPPILYEIGLEAALEWLIEQMETQYRLKVEFIDDGQPKELSEDARGILFRSVRELLFNVIKHASSLRAQVRIQKEDNAVRLTVSDEGAGFERERSEDMANRRSFGLFSIRERIEYLGGTFDCRTKPGEGTQVTIWMPCAAKLSSSDS